MTTWVVLNDGSLQIERELKIRLYGRESFCDRKALNRHGCQCRGVPGSRRFDLHPSPAIDSP